MGRRRAEVLVEKRWGQTHKLAFHLLDSFGGRLELSILRSQIEDYGLPRAGRTQSALWL